MNPETVDTIILVTKYFGGGFVFGAIVIAATLLACEAMSK